MQVERLQPGRKDQIVLRREPARYPNFEVRNIAANGEVWTGVGTNTRAHHPRIADLKARRISDREHVLARHPGELRQVRLLQRRRYPGRTPSGAPVWNDMETPVAQAVGPVEVSVLNHHGNRDSQNGFFLASLRPQVFIIRVWSADHPGHDVLDRMYSQGIYPGPRDVFAPICWRRTGW